MREKIVQVDAFTSKPFSGNPAAVCVLRTAKSEQWMQDVAAEMNLSETAFLYPEGMAYRLRWFTPTTEVALCGHATLASAHVLWEDGHLAKTSEAHFQTQSGLLLASLSDDWITLDFPATPVEAAAPPDGLLAAVGGTPRFVGKSRFDYLIELPDETAVRTLSPDLAKLATVKARGVIITARGDHHDFVSRFFAPAVGVPEDPVTGSSHCALAPYWAERLGRAEMRAFQASKRGGEMRVAIHGDRVKLSGRAVTTMRGDLCV